MIKSFSTKTRWLVTIILLTTLSIGQMWGTDVTLTESEIKSNFTSSAHAYGAGAASYVDGSLTWYLGDYNCTANSKWFQIRKNQGCYLKITSPANTKITSLTLTITSATNSSGGAQDISRHTAYSGRIALLTSDATGSSSMTGVGYTETISSNSATISVSGTNRELYLKTQNAARIWGASVTYVSTGTSVSLSKAATSNGSFTLRSGSCSGSEISSVTTTSSAQTVYIVPSPNTGYQVSSVTSKLGDAAAVNVSKSGDCYPVTYAKSASGTAVITVAFACATPTFGTNLSTDEVDYDQNESATALTVAASANSGTITYQWQVSDNGSSGWSNIGGATSASYTPPTNTIGTKYYHCIATNTTGGGCTATSNAAHIVVSGAPGYCINVYNSSDNQLHTGFSNGGSGNQYTLSGFTIPGKDGSSNWPAYWVGENSVWNSSFSADALFGDMPLLSEDHHKLGLAEGATGTLYIWNDNIVASSNLYIKFKPDGYGLRWGGEGEWDQAANTKAFTVDPGDANVWWTDLVTLDGTNNTDWNYYVGLKTSSGYVYSGVDNEASDSRGISRTRSVTAMKVSNGTSGSFKATYLNSEPTGTRGKFRVWDNNYSEYNFVCHFVPFWQLQYNANGGSGSMNPLPANPVSCEETTGNRTVTVATSSFTAPQYKQFDHWNTEAGGGGSNVSTGSYTLTGDVTLYAQWAYIPVTALTLNYSTLKKYVGESSVTLSVASVTPGTANPAVTWTSSDGTVASVTDGGVVSFLKAGTATITATSTVSGSITATCSVEVRSISSPTMQDEDGTTISGSGLSANWTLNTRTLAASEGTSKYKFKRWVVTNATPASTTNLSTTLGDPTGNVTVVAEFYKPRTVTKGTGTGTSTFTVSPTGEVKYGSSVTVTCAATDGYKNPWTLTVTPSDGATYSSSGSDGSITISNITKNITVDLAYTDKGCTTHKGNGVDEGSSYSNVYGPVNDNWKYGARQILYTKSDLGLAAGKKGTIKSISFQYQYSTAISDKDKVKIYMANTNLTSLSTSNYVTSFTEVYSGSMNCSNGWNEIELDTDFDYNGVGNLLVVIEDYSGKYTGSSYAFYYHEATTGIQLYNTTDGSAYDITAASTWTGGTAVAYRPNTKFCIEEDDMVKATVNWYVNGSIEHTQTDYPGTVLTGIPTPDESDCDGVKKFVGWYTAEYTHATNAPDFVEPEVIPEGGANYYAVFATVGSESTATFPASDLAGLTEDPDFWIWTHDASGIEFGIQGSRYTSKTPYTFSITANETGYLEAPNNLLMTAVAVTITESTYKINSVSSGWTLTTDGTSQSITSSGDRFLLMTATSSYQIRITTMTVTYKTCTNFTTSCCSDWSTPTVTYSSSLAINATEGVTIGSGTTYGAVSYASSDEDVLTVASDGTVTAVGAGTAHIVATWAGNATYCQKSANSNDITVSGIQVTGTTPVNFGQVYQNAVVADKTISVTGLGLANAITPSLPGGSPFSFSPASLAANASNAALTISASTTTIGDYTQTLTLTSGSFSATVTVKMEVIAMPTATFVDGLHNLTEDANGVSLSNYNLVAAQGTSVVFPTLADQPKSSGTCEGEYYKFIGWTTSDNNTDPQDHRVTSYTLANGDAITYHAVWADGAGTATYTKLTSNSFSGSPAKYVLGAEHEGTTYYFSDYDPDNIANNLSWGTCSSSDAPIQFTLSGTASALVAKDNLNNYLEAPCTTKAFYISGSETSVELKSNGTIYNNGDGCTSYRLRYNYNSGSGGLRWYTSDTGDPAYFYLVGAAGTVHYRTSCCANKVDAPVVTASSVTSVAITLTWPNDAKATGWQIEWNGAGGWVTPSGTRTHTVTGLTPGTTYTWRVRATYEDPVCGADIASGSTTTNPVYHVTYAKGDGEANCSATGSTTDATGYEAGATVTLQSNGFTLVGHTFNAWTEDDEDITISSNQFTMPDHDVVITASWTAKVDKYFDRMHDQTDALHGGVVETSGTNEGKYYIPKSGCNYDVPTAVDSNTGDACQTTHYKLQGWIAASYVAADGSITQANLDAHLFSPTTTPTKTATGATYYAVWAEVTE